jgi:hypothetical protein
LGLTQPAAEQGGDGVKVRILDRPALAERTQAEVAAYLRAHGWRPAPAGDPALWFVTKDGDEFEALLPDPAFRDYAARVGDVLGVLSIVEDRSELDIWRDMSMVTSDAHYIRAMTHAPAGTIPIEDGVAAFENARDLLAAAAASVASDRPRAVQPTRKPADVDRFMREVKIGPTFEGSFVLSILVPVPPQLAEEPGKPFEDAFGDPACTEPFGRKVSLRLYSAANAAREAAAQALTGPNGLDAFTGGLYRGISANLCEALAGLGGEPNNPFELSFSWAASRPVPTPTPPVCFRRDMIPVLAEAARELREQRGEEDTRVTGHVVRLHREGEGGTGEVSVAGTTDADDADRLRRIWMQLAPADYDKALRAHHALAPISVRGDLVRTGNRYRLRNIRDFDVRAEPAEPR